MVFPFKEARCQLVKQLGDGLPNGLGEHAKEVLSLHLRDDTLAMPKMSEEQYNTVQKKLRNGASVDKLREYLVLERTETRRGMLRVMARTHLNRSGINHVSQGYFEKTLSPRILQFVDKLDLDQPPCPLGLIKDWCSFAEQHSGEGEPDAIRYDDRACKTLKALREVIANKNFDICSLRKARCSGNKLQQATQQDLGWCRIFLGILTGWLYLHEHDWNAHKQVTGNSLGFEESHGLICQCRDAVCEFGYALAGSFFADLGGGGFVKDDTHVSDCIEAVAPDLKSAREHVEATVASANELHIPARVVDKVMYIGGSGRLPLFGVRVANPRHFKCEFIEFLRKTGRG